MTEKSYGGAAPFRKEGNKMKGAGEKGSFTEKEKKPGRDSGDFEEELDRQKTIQAGKIASEIMNYAREIVGKDVLLIDIAEKIESRIEELGGKPAFPVNLSIDDVAAHYTPSPEDKTVARGLLKVDFGVHVDGWIADTAISFDLDGSEENASLIKAAEEAVRNALKIVKLGVSMAEVGKEVMKTIESHKANPIINLTGHSIFRYELHSGTSVPNYDNGSPEPFEDGIYAIEPFATRGTGRVYGGKPSGIYELVSDRNVRSPIARKILDFIIEEYSTLPFCSRWIVKKFGSLALFGLKQLEENGNLHQFEQLIESSHRNVAQAEHTILIEGKSVTVTTR